MKESLSEMADNDYDPSKAKENKKPVSAGDGLPF